MNRQEFEDTARRYREELFRMYAGQNMNPPPKPPQGNRPVPPPPPKPPQGNRPVPPPPMPPQGNRPSLPLPPLPRVIPAMAESDNMPETMNPAEITLSEPTESNTNEPDTIDSIAEESAAPEVNVPVLPKPAYTGIIRVHVVTAQGAKPVAGASVIISQLSQGEPELISLQTTDQNGNINAVTVPAPPPSADQRHPESYLYDITAQAAGYYREHSTDVPVFPNTTSIQNFDMIPLPAGNDDPISDSDITFYNDMQQY